MASKEADFSERDLSSSKYLDRLLPLLARLHDFGSARDRAGNRQLHYDQYCLLVLLALFNPVVRSLRAIFELEVERWHVLDMLKQETWNKIHAAKALGVSRRAHYRLIGKYKLQET